MLPNDVALFGITLFLALALLVRWKRRRVLMARRVNRGLRGYVSGSPSAASAHKDERQLSAA